ncbi:AraC family transcriptional regulator [Massilia forsythiae]|uniref:AraC family transcriptional regulator n=1 Tax=Massilia forsythiae TaxID=2728020 RepID=A0A7Z2ZTQ4_9BURK|nr:AraC family transcriptional regulator [Massilia forsythiae]QJE01510.1 AraC family transcriptional regulator [Massilia forsythiae]
MSTYPSDHVERVNRAIDHIVRDLARPARLEDVAKVAGFSPFHFHRIFKSTLGETLNQFCMRLRLERALYLMSHAPARSLTEVALHSGFSSSSDFSRSFRRQYGVAPSTFELERFRRDRHHELPHAMRTKDGESVFATPLPGENPDGFVAHIRDLPARTVAYIRVLEPYRQGIVQAAYERLLRWALARGVADGKWLGYSWDEPEVVGIAACRYDIALVVDDVALDGEIGRFDFPPMRVAEVDVDGDLALESRAIDWLYATWLPQSGYMPDEQPMFEAWHGRPYAHGSEHFALACQLAVTRM